MSEIPPVILLSSEKEAQRGISMARQSTRPPLETIQAELADPDYRVRKGAIKRLMRYHRKQACEPLLELLKDGRGDVRAKAVQALAKLKDQSAFVPVLGLLADKNASVRAQVALALGEFGNSSVVPQLMDLLNAPQARVCACAARSLGKLRAPCSLPALLAYLERTRRTGDKDELYHAVRALGDFGSPAVVEPLLALRERSASHPVHWMVVDVLRRAGEQIRPLLAQILIDQARPVHVRACVAQALDRPSCPEYLPSLLIALTDEHPVIREKAANALVHIQDPCTIEPLMHLLTDPNPGVLAAVSRALSAQHAPTVMDSLTNLRSTSSDTNTHRAIDTVMLGLRLRANNGQ
jgi:HEAT repeat protein